MTAVATVVLVAALIAAGLLAGLFYAYACSVMPGLARGDDRTYVEAMRGINLAIINPVFMLTFLGAPLAAGAAVVLHLAPDVRPALPWVVAGFALLVAMLVITGVVNVPLNNALESGTSDYAGLRARFETVWVRWNLVRAVVSTGAFGCLVAALLARRG
ncbi:DUF1772 domain-containing protein [Amycolatopsis cynarae]|uniref:DUF1772 domain-containing protein n=1 Tax=Amycolatopsis cynarae TaxID=2995223 RepID=A0ABY7B2D8_9PSEU|nr:anthrone oxygenase family protein [Amycolatopsis sp. HUAS 11-8]WAL66467.1 DUF1772 domain-containing protein [Amycolatopsis sp. HUAS 11-8]